MRKKALCLIAALVLYLSVALTGICFADQVVDMQCIDVKGNQETYTFTVTRLKSVMTGKFVHTKEIRFTYDVRCEDDNENILKTFKGSGSIPAGENETTVDIREIADEMKGQLEKHDPIYMWFDITQAEDANCLSTEALDLTGKTLQDALSEMTGLSSADIESIKSLIQGTGEASAAVEQEGASQTEAADETEDMVETYQNDISGTLDKDTDKQVQGDSEDVFAKVKSILYFVCAAVVLIAGIIITIVVISRRNKQYTPK